MSRGKNEYVTPVLKKPKITKYRIRYPFLVPWHGKGIHIIQDNRRYWTIPVDRAVKRIVGPQGKMKLGPPSPILHIMILKLSPPRCVISKESVQQNWIDELWFRKQLSTCLFVWTLNHNSWTSGRSAGWHPLSVPVYPHRKNTITSVEGYNIM